MTPTNQWTDVPRSPIGEPIGQSATLSARIFWYSSRALSYSALACVRSLARIRGAFCSQHLSSAFRHHSADFLLARIGLPSTSTNTGLVWLDGKIRRHTQLLCGIGTSSNAT